MESSIFVLVPIKWVFLFCQAIVFKHYKSNFKVEQSFGVSYRNIEAAIAQLHVIDGQQEVADVLHRFTK